MSTINLIAIDGPAASGKSTLAELIAKNLDYFFFDTGVMYRAVTLAALVQVNDLDDETKVTEVANRIQIDVQPASKQDGRVMDILVDGKDVTWQIRTPEVDFNVSKVSAYAGVRKAMTEQQRRIGERGNMVMVGRDIGTVVFPDAKHKIYLEASPEERARRRFVEVQNRGESTTYEEILASIRKRDEVDSSRAVAPLKPAEDAYVIDSDDKTIDIVLKEVLQILGKSVS
ncbi:MAG: cytidylate kinase [Chloroflexi bacterium HGW-Chloroflexi-5]|jgi:cytidylate kinase|nr:MAG: cytidylate kinase [Chloroflexi bacterium HGW-Chloroflexi-5]